MFCVIENPFNNIAIKFWGGTHVVARGFGAEDLGKLRKSENIGFDAALFYIQLLICMNVSNIYERQSYCDSCSWHLVLNGPYLEATLLNGCSLWL